VRAYVLRRVGATLIVLWLASVGAFLLLRLAPGDPARLVAGPLAGPAAIASVRSEMRLNESPVNQYVGYVSDLVHGNFGTAWHLHEPVGTLIGQRLPATAELAVYASILGILGGVLFGAIAASRPGGIFDRVVRGIATIGLGTPVFWLGLVLTLLFYADWHIAPVPIGRLSVTAVPPPQVTGFLTIDSLLAGNLSAFGDALAHLALPAITLAIPMAAYLARVTRASVMEVYESDYVRTARAKGAPERRTLFRHALRNGLLPVMTLAALSIGDLLSGTLLVEAVFNWPGVGGMTVDSIAAHDFAPVEAMILLAALTYCVLNLLTDLLYAVVDPRVRLQK
jgi:peptide/nickel transport system permease protein